MIRAWNGLMMALQLIAGPLVAQATDSLATVQGVAYDSLGGRPLRSATIRIAGQEATAVSDSAGRFELQRVPRGDHLLVMEHPLLDSIGLPEIAMRLRVVPAMPEILVAIPSFQRMWNAVCGTSVAPKDSGFMYGAIRDANDERGLPNARVTVSWTDLGISPERKIQQKRMTLETRSDSTGAYIACGLPRDVPMDISVTAPDSSTETAIGIPARTTRVQRRDLFIATSSRNAKRSVIRGRVFDTQNVPLANVRVMVDGFEATRTDSSGNFAYFGAPAGTHQVEFISIGSSPISKIVDVIVGSTVTADARLERVTTLEKVDVKATIAREALRALDERKRMGFGYIEDSSFVVKRPTMQSVFREFPSVTVGRERFEPGIYLGGCEANYFVDGFRVDKLLFYAVPLYDVAWVEVYTRASSLPREFMTGRGSTCGAAVIFRKAKIGR